jgi:hypothetical protein
LNDDLIQLTNGKARLYLHPGQSKAWDCERRFVFVVAGTQGGKTSFGPWWLWREIKRQGAGDYLAVTATYDLFKLKMLPEMRRVFCELLPGWTFSASDRVIVSKDGETRIILRSANAPGGLESATAKAAWLDECGQDDFRLESWEAVQRRLSLSRGRVLGTTTPYNLGWLKSEIYDRWRAGNKDYQVVQFKSIQNPRFPLEEYERAKASLPKWKFEMFYNGEFSRPAGLIYEDFVDEYREAGGHLVKPFVLPKHWPRYVGIDFGAVHTALIWIAKDPDKEIYYVYRSTLDGNKTTNEHAAAALTLAKNENVVRWTGGARSETQQRMDWNAAHVPVQQSPIIDVEAGIDRVIALFKGKRLFVFDTERGLIEELNTYSRELDDAGQPTEKIRNKETFHRLDGLRYDASALEAAVSIIDDPLSGW